MKRIKFAEQIAIRCSAEFAFDYSQDYEKRLNWDTFLKRAELLNGATKAGLGVRTYCVAKNGIGIETEYVSFDRPSKTAIKMTKEAFMFSSFSGSWTFRETHPNLTKVIFLYSFQLRFPFNLVKLLIRRNLQMNVRKRLTDLKANIENQM